MKEIQDSDHFERMSPRRDVPTTCLPPKKGPPPVPPLPPRLLPRPLNGNGSPGSEQTKGGSVHECAFSTMEKESHKAYTFFLKSHARSDTEDSFTFITGYQPVVPVIQSGPLCGMVALAMASDVTGGERVLTEDIYKEARARGYSKQGEMFSAKSMAALASHFLKSEVELVSFNTDEGIAKFKDKIISNLMMQNCVVIPYDADKDHGPCLKTGHKAHWAILTGFFLAVPSSKLPSWLKNVCTADPEESSILRMPCSSNDFSEENIMSFLKEADKLVYVFGHQGKSKYAGVWSTDDLIQSNFNLVEAGPERLSEDYIIPTGGLPEGLQGQAIFISSKK